MLEFLFWPDRIFVLHCCAIAFVNVCLLGIVHVERLGTSKIVIVFLIHNVIILLQTDCLFVAALRLNTSNLWSKKVLAHSKNLYPEK